MGLFEDAARDNQQILGDVNGATVPVIFTSPPVETDGIPANTVFGTLDPDDFDNQIRSFVADHYTQIDPTSGIPQAGLNAHSTVNLKTLLENGIITDVTAPNFQDWKISWLDITDPTKQRDFLIDKILPTRSLTHVVFILGEINIA